MHYQIADVAGGTPQICKYGISACTKSIRKKPRNTASLSKAKCMEVLLFIMQLYCHKTLLQPDTETRRAQRRTKDCDRQAA